MGICGGLRCNELTNLNIEAVKDKGSFLYVSIPETKTSISRSFTVLDEGFSVNAMEICKKYIRLRPERNISQGRFFLRYTNSKCTVQPVGINTLSRIPSQIASFLKLPDAESYTGHSMRRSSATLLANAGGDIITLKRHGGWRSSSVVEGYIEESESNKIDIARKIQGKSSTVQEISTMQSSSNAVCVNVKPDIANKFTFDVNVNVNINVNK